MINIIKQILYIGAGGFAGSVMRYLTGQLIKKITAPGHIFWGTLAVNAAGCFLIGFLFPLLTSKSNISDNMRLLVITGFLGGFTTFSSLAFETVSLARSSLLLFAALNMILNIALGISALVLGERAFSAVSML